MENDMSPRATHDMYLAHDMLMPFNSGLREARERYDRYASEGYFAVAGIVAFHRMTVRQALKMHEKSAQYIAAGDLVGPYFMGEELLNGIQLFRRIED